MMSSLHKYIHPIYTVLRTFSLAAKHVKDKKPPRELEMVIERGAQSDNARLVEFYSNTYLQHDPVVRASGVTDLRDLQHFLSASLSSQHSVLLTDRADGRVVAAASGGNLNYTTDSHLRLYASSEMSDSASRRLVHFWADVTSQSGLLEHIHLPIAWDVSFVAVEPRLQKIGLARFLLAQHMRLAEKHGYQALCVECSSHYMAKVCERAGCQLLPGRTLESYRDPFGNPWISGALQPPHHFIHIYYHLLKGRKNSTYSFT